MVMAMMATKIETQAKTGQIKFAKTRKVLRAFGRGAKAFLKISPFIAAPIFAQQKDSTKMADETFFKASLSAKTMVRAYDGGKNAGAGIGFEAGLDVGKIGSLGVSFTGVKQKGTSGMIVEEESVSGFVPVGPVAVIPYVYRDLFFKAPDATWGTIVKGFGVKVGAEVSTSNPSTAFWDAFIKVPLANGTITPQLTFVGWGESGASGPVQKVNLILTSDNTYGPVSLSSKVMWGMPIRDAQGKLTTENDGGLTFRLVASVPVF